MKKEVKDKKKKVSIWKYVKKCYPYFKREKKALIILIIISLIISIFNSFGPALMAKVLDYATSSRLDVALKYLLFVVGLALVIDFFDKIVFTRNYTKIQESITNNIKKDVISSYFEIDNKELLKTSSGIFLTRITSDPDNIINAFDAVRGNFTKILSNIFVFIYIFHINFVLGIITIIGTICVYLVEKSAMDKWNAYRKRRNKLRDRNTTIINEGLKGTHDIKLLNIVEHFKNKVSGNLDELCNDTVGSIKVDSDYVFLRTIVVYTFTTILIVLSIYFVKFDVIKVSSLIAIFMYKDRLFTSILYLAWTERQLKEFALSAERIFEVIDHSKFKLEHYGNKRVNELSGKIEFKNVYFKYKKDSVLKGVSFNIEPKDTVAIVGKSGSGKTTIVNLLMKFYDINSGCIKIDGIPLSKLTRENIHQLFIMVLQDTWLFNGTIRDNIKYNKPDVSDDEIWASLETVGVAHFVKSLPHELDYQITDNESISAGQKQLLTIARGMIKDAPFLILDEATSSVDTRTEELVQKAMDKLTEGRTSFIIAHRLSTIKNADHILVMKDGNIIEQGNHEELLAKNGFYAKLYNSQFEN